MLWAECLERLRKHVSDNHFTMWIRPLEAEEHSDCLKLYVPSPYWKSHIEKDYHEIISIMAEQISEGRVRQVDILVGSRPGKDILKQSKCLQQRQQLYKVHLHKIPPHTILPRLQKQPQTTVQNREKCVSLILH